jgi:hypothetical protein
VALEDDLSAMPLAYAVALRLEALGAEPEMIAGALGVEPESVPTLLDVAHRKLAEFTPGPRPPDGPRGEPS